MIDPLPLWRPLNPSTAAAELAAYTLCLADGVPVPLALWWSSRFVARRTWSAEVADEAMGLVSIALGGGWS